MKFVEHFDTREEAKGFVRGVNYVGDIDVETDGPFPATDGPFPASEYYDDGPEVSGYIVEVTVGGEEEDE